MSGINQSILKWDGSEIGSIEIYIDFPSIIVNNKSKRILNLTNNKTPIKLNIYKDYNDEDNTHLLEVWSTADVKFTKLRNNIPLISDIMKSVFGMPYIGLHTCKFDKDSYLMINNQDIILLNQYMKNKDIDDLPYIFIEEIRKVFIYKWLMCITQNTENNIMVRKFTFPEDIKYKPKYDLVYPISYNELDFDISKSELSSSVIKKWFNNDEMLVEEVKYQILGNKTSRGIKASMERMTKKFMNNDFDETSLEVRQQQEKWIQSVFCRIDSL